MEKVLIEKDTVLELLRKVVELEKEIEEKDREIVELRRKLGPSDNWGQYTWGVQGTFLKNDLKISVVISKNDLKIWGCRTFILWLLEK